jgi:hypothetical protein
VGGDGAFADHELGRDGMVALTPGNLGEHLPLADREATGRERRDAYRFEDDRVAEMWMVCTAPAGSETLWS